eukprot:4311906-Alexandrium_andersonii.AAC.1
MPISRAALSGPLTPAQGDRTRIGRVDCRDGCSATTQSGSAFTTLLLGSAGPCLLSISGREACAAGERPWMKSICPND